MANSITINNFPKTFVRDRKGNPYGVVLATKNGVGFSLTNTNYDKFDKKKAEMIARNRANFQSETRTLKIPAKIAGLVEIMEYRRKRYFKID